MTFAEIFLALMLLVGPPPGQTLYSYTPVTAESSDVVALMPMTIGGRETKVYQLVTDATAPPQCAQPKNPACRRVRFNGELGRYERPETFREGLARYWQVSQLAAQHAHGDRDLLDLMFVVVLHESGNARRDVHEGTNHRPSRRRTKHEDGGRSWCLGQFMAGVSPRSQVAMTRKRRIRAGELVGLDDDSTSRCLAVMADHLGAHLDRCKDRNGGKVAPACVFTSYAGTGISSDHPLMRARVGTWQRVQRTKLELGAKVRRLLLDL